MFTEKLWNGDSIRCQLIPMGQDMTITVYGGDTPHVGSVVLSIARPSLTGKGISVTSSVLNSVGHKDEAVARMFAESIAKKKNCTVACSCGIHVEQIDEEGLFQVKLACERLLSQVLEAI